MHLILPVIRCSGNAYVNLEGYAVFGKSFRSRTYWKVPQQGPVVSDAYEGSPKGSKACMNRIRIYARGDPQGAKEVYYQRDYLSLFAPLTKSTDIPLRGCHAEMFGTPKHHSSPRGQSPLRQTAHLSLDAWRGTKKYVYDHSDAGKLGLVSTPLLLHRIILTPSPVNWHC